MMASYYPPVSFEDISPLLMPPSQYSVMLPSNNAGRLNRSSAIRRPYSTTTTPGGSKRSSLRVTKPVSHGHSPHHVQRRKTTTTQPGRETFSGIPYRIRNTHPHLHSGFGYPVPDVRPYSWHPDVNVSFSDPRESPSDHHCIGTAISGLQNLAMDGSPARSEASMPDNNFYNDGQQSIPMSVPLQPQSNNDYYSQSFAPATFIPTQYDQPLQPTQLYPYPYIFNMLPASNVSMAPPTGNGAASNTETQECPDLQHSKPNDGEELVGIGLYDDREQGNRSGRMVPSSTIIDTNLSRGKELKLEESWQPAESNENDEDSSEEVEEPNSAVTVSAPPEVHPMVYPANSDLSGQSFFFTEDDTNSGHELANYMAYQSAFGQQPLEAWKQATAAGQQMTLGGVGNTFMYV